MVSTRPEFEAAQNEYESFLSQSGLPREDLHHVLLEEVDFLDAFTAGDVSGVLIGGSPYDVSTPEGSKTRSQMHVEEQVRELLAVALKEGVPVLATGFGLEVLAGYLGTSTSREFGEELGATEIFVTADGRADPLLADLPQAFTALVVYFDEVVPRVFYGFEVPVAWGASLQSVWVLLLSGSMATLWTWLGRRQPHTPMKFALSLFVMALGYYCFVPYTRSGEPMSIWVFALALMILTVAELLISPIATSFATKIAPRAFRTQAVAVSYLSLSLGFTASGAMFDTLYDPKAQADFYLLLVVCSLVAGVALLVLVPMLNRMLKDVD